MRLRALIQGARRPRRPNPGPLRQLRLLRHSRARRGDCCSQIPRRLQQPPTVATVATVAALPEPETWPALVRAVAVPGVRWDLAADRLASLMEADVVEAALIRGWHALELIGVRHAKPHDHPSYSGLVFSIHRGDAVEAISDIGCAIVTAGTNVRHLWRRTPLPTDGSICLPWEIRA